MSGIPDRPSVAWTLATLTALAALVLLLRPKNLPEWLEQILEGVQKQ